jgi:hypothetical protein
LHGRGEQEYVGWARMINLEMLIVSLIALAHLTVTGFDYRVLYGI